MFYKIRCGHNLTISKILKISGLTSRTLRHWEKLGLLNPLYRAGEKKRRYYKGGKVLILQQILLLKRSGMPLGEIKKKITTLRKDHIKLLHEQNKNLKKELEGLSKLVGVVDKTILSLRGKPTRLLSDYEILSCFNKKHFNKKQKSVQYRKLIAIN